MAADPPCSTASKKLSLHYLKLLATRDWRRMTAEHPLAICAIAVAGTIGVCTAITFQWVVPTMTASIVHTSDMLAERVAELEKQKADLSEKLAGSGVELAQARRASADAIAQREAHIAQLQDELFDSQRVNAFATGYPYPVGLDKVKLGDPIQRITEIYQKVDYESKSYRAVKTGEKLFTDISFSFGRSENSGKIEGVRFVLGSNVMRKYSKEGLPTVPDGWLESALKRALGSNPKIIGPEEDCLVWALDNPKILVYYNRDGDDYFISEKLSPGGCYITDEQLKTMSKEAAPKTK